jgi:23S rRNA (cytosine1962-C5)-methyltransferase
MESRPVRWIVDDAAKFTAREVRRGKRYDGIIMDPPNFGRGPGEVWRLEEHARLVSNARALLDDNRFLFLTVYAVRMSSLAIAGLLAEAFADLPGRVERMAIWRFARMARARLAHRHLCRWRVD